MEKQVETSTSVVTAAAGQASAYPSVVQHEGIWCDGCKMKPLMGPRFKCMTCEDYDLCTTCSQGGVHASTGHSFRRVLTQQEIKFNALQDLFTPGPADVFEQASKLIGRTYDEQARNQLTSLWHNVRVRRKGDAVLGDMNLKRLNVHLTATNTVQCISWS